MWLENLHEPAEPYCVVLILAKIGFHRELTSGLGLYKHWREMLLIFWLSGNFYQSCNTTLYPLVQMSGLRQHFFTVISAEQKTHHALVFNEYEKCDF